MNKSNNPYLIMDKQYWQIEESHLIGSDANCKIQIYGKAVSARHCRIEKKENDFILRDLKSSSGTFLNSTQIREAVLNEGDLISIGDFSFRFSHNSPLSKQNRMTSKNRKWDHQLSLLPKFAQMDHPILLQGPSGSGKEILAHHIHQLSTRRFGPFVAVNCGALSENLIESELFGHIKGAFTGAIDHRKGAFESARGGTLFLDEIGELPLNLQTKLLRALENSEIRPVGSDRIIKTDVRIIAATHQNLQIKIQNEQFRNDLFFRLNVFPFFSPPLIQRMEDFEDLFYSYCKTYRIGFSHGAIELLKTHSWPGNIRELKNVVIRAAATNQEKRVEVSDLPHILQIKPTSQATIGGQLTPASNVIKDIERSLILEALQKNKGNQLRTAKTLGMPRSTLYDRIRNYNIDPKQYTLDFRA